MPTATSPTTCRLSTATPHWPPARCCERGRRAEWVDLTVRPPAAFLRNYVVRRGLRDGAPGLIVSLLNAGYVFLKFAKLWEQQRAGDGNRR